jgi:hypothetical protein
MKSALSCRDVAPASLRPGALLHGLPDLLGSARLSGYVLQNWPSLQRVEVGTNEGRLVFPYSDLSTAIYHGKGRRRRWRSWLPGPVKRLFQPFSPPCKQ